jgi:4a-hydroxytetrahydrobiopterin dehydratase
MTDDEIGAELDHLPAWRRDGPAIVRTVPFKGFMRPLLLATAIGHLAERANHHPELIVRWGSLTIRLWTHDTDGLTARDFALARRIDDLLGGPPT